MAPSGETAAVLDLLDYDFMIAFNIEGLGTKNMIADKMYSESKRGKTDEKHPEKYYRYLGQDTLAMSVTDLVAVGADPIAYSDEIASGDSKWFNDTEGGSPCGRLGTKLREIAEDIRIILQPILRC